MFLHGLKINIAVHLAVLISLAMVLINLVMMTAFQRILVNSEISKGYLLASVIQRYWTNQLNKENHNLSLDFKNHIETTIHDAGYACALILDKDYRVLHYDNASCPQDELLEKFVRQAILSGGKMVRFSGATWGVFWKQKEYLIITMPLHNEKQIIGGAGLVFHLQGIYTVLRQMQHLLWMYMIANVIVLTFVGFYQLSKITIKPIYRLLKRAEEYKEDDETFFKYENKNNEFNRLSSALNLIVMRISKDKVMLQSTIKSLENANAELKQAQREIIRAEKMASIGRLSSGLAHEIGNPIGIVLGYLDLLKHNDLEEEEKREFIIRAEKEIKRINTVIQRLLNFSRPANEDFESISVHEVIHELVDMVKPQPFMSTIRLTIDLAAGKDLVAGNPNSLQQVFLNLLINAADGISSDLNIPDGHINIRSENTALPNSKGTGQNQTIEISFVDNGTGIPEKSLGNIFDPFFTTKDPGKGTGLGLSVCFMIIEAMSGTIEAVSDAHNGTTMTVTLPLSENAGDQANIGPHK